MVLAGWRSVQSEWWCVCAVCSAWVVGSKKLMPSSGVGGPEMERTDWGHMQSLG